MNILIYALAAVLAGVLGMRAPRTESPDPVRRAFGVLATTLAVLYGGFTLHLILEPRELKYVSRAAAVLVAPAVLRFFELFFAAPDRSRSPWLQRLSITAGPVLIAFIVSDAWLWQRWLGSLDPAAVAAAGGPPGEPWWVKLPELAFATYVFVGLAAATHRLWQLHELSPRPLEKARIRYLLLFAGAALGFSLIEALVRLIPVAASENLLLTRTVVVQGAAPPVGAVCAALFLYFVHQLLTEQRRLEPGDLLSRLAAVGVAASILVGMEVLSVALVGTLWIHNAFQALIAAMLFLFAYDPLRKQLERWMGNVFNRRAQRLQDTLRELDDGLGRVVSIDGWAQELQQRLLDSGRLAYVALYLWDGERRAYRFLSERGEREDPPPLHVARQPFTDGFADGQRAYLRADLERIATRDSRRADELGERLALLREMSAEVALPFRAGDVVLGWLALRELEHDEGFTEEEVARLAQTTTRAAVVLENLHDFEKLKEEHRLAGLGTMAAGLAHEIRNPLAGIKGAAQYLQTSREGPDAEMVQVIIDEVDRLSIVVSQFLDYARPYQVHREEVAVGALVARVAGLLRAQALDDVVVVEDVAPDLPAVEVDAPKLTQVLLNLGQNAVQAMRHGGTLTLHARVGALRDPKARRAPALEIAVEDTGVGIPAADLDKLFVPFFTTRHDGTGLGLAISRRIVHAHGGELDVASSPGRGSTFTVRVPLAS